MVNDDSAPSTEQPGQGEPPEATEASEATEAIEPSTRALRRPRLLWVAAAVLVVLAGKVLQARRPAPVDITVE